MKLPETISATNSGRSEAAKIVGELSCIATTILSNEFINFTVHR